jgi:hypothetical protein
MLEKVNGETEDKSTDNASDRHIYTSSGFCGLLSLDNISKPRIIGVVVL